MYSLSLLDTHHPTGIETISFSYLSNKGNSVLNSETQYYYFHTILAILLFIILIHLFLFG